MMKKIITHITIILKPSPSKEFVNFLPTLYAWLSRRKKKVYFLEKEIVRLDKIFGGKIPIDINFLESYSDINNTDLILSLGGDGTFIGIARQLTPDSPPIFGVNMGNLGFITEFSKNEFYEDLTLCLKGDIEIHNERLFTVKVVSKGKTIFKENFINDVVVTKHDISRLVTLDLSTSDDHLFRLKGDGIIISSPLGSTAYSMAAGGPIVHPHVRALILTPICPHALTHRPLVIPDKQKIKVKVVQKQSDMILTLDGQSTFNITANDEVVISKDPSVSIKICNNSRRTYFQTLKDKFYHGRSEF